MIHALLERAYRREYGRVVSMLAARFGVHHLEEVEDGVQLAWTRALRTWPEHGVPDDPTAWLFRVARNALVDRLRTERRRARILAQAPTESTEAPPEVSLESEVPDAQLAMLFVCCDPKLPRDAQRVLALRILFGSTVAELAEHLFTSEENVYKRLQRARSKLRTEGVRLELEGTDLTERVPVALSVLHTVFTEGYASVRADATVRADLCDEAIRLTTMLAGHAQTNTPQTAALLATMHLHRARLHARTDGAGGLLLLQEQDRSTWNRDCIAEGMRWLARSARGDTFSRYHAEAGIAAEHCRAPSFEQTDWERVVTCYRLLEHTAPSALHRLGHAMALAEWKGAPRGLAFVQSVAPPSWLEGSFPWFVVLADLHHRCGHAREAQCHRMLALDAAPTPALRALLERRFASIDRGGQG